MADDNDIERAKARQAYGWAWFDFHARQRTTIFNFFLVASSLFIAGYATIIKAGPYYMAAMVALAGVFASYGFLCLDARNRQLVRWGEKVLIQSERDFLFSDVGHQSVSASAHGRRPGILSREGDISREADKDELVPRHSDFDSLAVSG